MKTTILATFVLGLGVATSSQAASFLNGGFESGNLSGWTVGGGSNSGNTADGSGNLLLNPANYTNTSAFVGVVTSAGTDAITGQSMVRFDSHSVRINDTVRNYSVSKIAQTVSNYDGTSINFSWAAVLEDSHTITDSDIFGLKVTDTTTGTTLYNATYSSANSPACGAGVTGLCFNKAGNWYWNAWQDVSLTVTQGHDFEVSLLAADCPYGGHAGYVYLDGFGTVQGGGGDNGTGGGNNNVPVPASLALAGLGLLTIAGVRRRKSV